MGQRAKTKKHPLKWEFIGGKLEDGEDLITALEREFKEEVGLDIKALKLIDKNVYNYVNEDGMIEINFIECEPFTGIPNFDPAVYEICKWVLKEEMPKLDWVEADKDFVMSLAQK